MCPAASGSRLTTAQRVGLGLIMACLTVAPSATPLLQEDIEENATGLSENWMGTFHHIGLDQFGQLLTTPDESLVYFGGSQPSPLLLELKLARTLAQGHELRVYAGWPQNDRGEITGVRNCSNDSMRTRLTENKLGPTLLWAVAGCRRVCVQGVLLKYNVNIRHGAEVHEVNRLAEPVLDSGAIPESCLAPAFLAQPAGGYAGALDQPGTTVSDVGDWYRDTSGAEHVIAAGDQLDIEFEQRAFISCNSAVIAMVEWGYRLTATLGKPAEQITPTILQDIDPQLSCREDPLSHKRFDLAVAQFRETLAAAGQPPE